MKEVIILLEIDGEIIDKAVSGIDGAEVKANARVLLNKHLKKISRIKTWSVYYTAKSLVQ